MKGWINNKLQIPTVSIVCITYNHEKYIKEALDSFLMQKTTFPFNIIVSDDCSTDNTAHIIKMYAKKYPTIIKATLRNKNIGMIANGFESSYAADGKYIAFCEGDDYWTDRHKLQIQINKMEEYPLCKISFHPVTKIHDNDTPNHVFGDYYEKDKLFDTKAIISKITCPMSSIIITKDVMYNYPDKLKDIPIGDFFMQIYASINGGALYLNKVMAIYRIHDTGTHTSRQTSFYAMKKHYENMLPLIKKLDEYLDFKYHDDFQELFPIHLNNIINNKSLSVENKIEFYKLLQNNLSKKDQNTYKNILDI